MDGSSARRGHKTTLLRSFIRNRSRSDSASPIQPLPPESLGGDSVGHLAQTREIEWSRKPIFPCHSPGCLLGRWRMSPPNPWGSDLADQNDHYRAAPSWAEGSRVPTAECHSWLQPRTIQQSRRSDPANPSAAEHRHSRRTFLAKEDGSSSLRREPGPAGTTHPV